MNKSKKNVAIFKSILGLILIIISNLFVMFGTEKYYGYLDDHPFLVSIPAVLIAFYAFFYLLTSYYDYLRDLNKVG